MPDLKNVPPSPRPRRLSQLKDAWKNKRSVTIVYLLLRASVILVLIAQIFNRNFENVFLCVLTLFLFGVPNMVQHRLDIELPNTLEIIILLFIYAAEILGEINAYYVTFPYWDTVLHTLNGFLCAAVGFSLLDILNREEKIGFSLSPLYLAIVAFCFSMTVGVIWEFFECTMDQLFLLDMQKDTVVNTIGSVMLDPTGGNNPGVIRNITDVIVVQSDGTRTALGLGGYLDIGLLDTMEDLFVNFIGAFTFSIIGYFYVRSRGKNKFAKRFIPVVNEEPQPQTKNTSAEDAPETKKRKNNQQNKRPVVKNTAGRLNSCTENTKINREGLPNGTLRGLWSWWPDLNRRPADYESAALPTEPHQHNNNSILDFWHKSRGNGAKVEKIFWVGYFCS